MRRKAVKSAVALFSLAFFIQACGTAVTTEVTKGAREKARLARGEEAPPEEGAKVRAFKKRVAVVDFEMKSKLGRLQLASDATDILITALVKSGKFVVIERDKLHSLLKEQKLGLSDLVNPATAAKVGRLLGVNAIITGAVTNFGIKLKGSSFLGLAQSKTQVAEAEVDIRVVDVETGKILFADRGVGTAESSSSSILGVGSAQTYDPALAGKALRAAIDNLVDRLVSALGKLPWRASVAMVKRSKNTGKIYVYLNAGYNEGLRKGDEIYIYAKGEPIVDPDTGEVIGYEEEFIGKAKVVSFYGDNKYAKAVVVSGVTPRKGFIVKLEPPEEEE